MSLILTAAMPFSIGHHHCIKHIMAIKCLLAPSDRFCELVLAHGPYLCVINFYYELQAPRAQWPFKPAVVTSHVVLSVKKWWSRH